MIKVASCHQRMPRPCQIITAAGLGPGQAIDHILREPHIPNSYSHDFEKNYKGQRVDEGEKIQENVDIHGSRIYPFSSVTSLAYL